MLVVSGSQYFKGLRLEALMQCCQGGGSEGGSGHWKDMCNGAAEQHNAAQGLLHEDDLRESCFLVAARKIFAMMVMVVVAVVF
jgi:hypothetical protein